jgi:hypothetical protein
MSTELAGTALRFVCRLRSPFHTTRQEYAGLWKCAPFILGSTLRGALLTHLITTHYDDADIQAGTFQRQGLVAPFFACPPRVYFSFGRFPDGVERRMQAHTRIAIERAHGSVAEGALLSVEAVPAGTPFEFDVLLPGQGHAGLAALVARGLRHMAQTTSLGGLRSIGMGQFSVEDVQAGPLSAHVERLGDALWTLDGGALDLTFVTPYVLSSSQAPWNHDAQALARRLEAELAATVHALGLEATPPRIARVDAALRPDFMSRWSYEQGGRENRLVAWGGSRLTLHLHEPGDLYTVFPLALAFGLGEWAEWGLGRFEVTPSHV